MILDRLIDKMGNSNPQIFRELKERLTPKNISIAVIAALIAQGFVLLYFNGQIPVPAYETTPVSKLIETHSNYCLFPPNNSYNDSLCKLNKDGFAINWQTWWADVFICLCWILPLGLMLGSVYTLVADIVQEEKRGTLNFIRLSPQSAQTIFIGKIFGVPILVYLAVALMLPLHLFAGIHAQGSIPFLASWYLIIGVLSFLISSAAVLYVLLGGIQAILTVVGVAYPICLPLLIINTFASGTINHATWFEYNKPINWFWLPVASNAIWLYAFGIGCCSIASYWIWQALERRYLNPTATIFSKSQSYLANFCFQLWMAGFALPLIIQNSSSFFKESGVAALAVIDFSILLLLIPTLLPNKQSLLDWSRYRRERVTHQHRQFWQRELVQDLISNDKSPALLAIAINIGMAMVLWMPLSMIAFKTSTNGLRFLAGIFIAASLILIYATIAHLGVFLNVKKRNLWTIGSLTGAMILPLLGAYVLSPVHAPTGLAAILLLFSPFVPMGILQLAGGSILATFAAQLVILTALTHQLQRKLQIGGRSQTKELLVHG